MAGCKRCALKGGGIGKAKKKRKEKKKGRKKMGIKIVCVFLFCFFISPSACFFICAVVIFQISRENYI